jgi:hypothetical protein
VGLVAATSVDEKGDERRDLGLVGDEQTEAEWWQLRLRRRRTRNPMVRTQIFLSLVGFAREKQRD